MGRMVERKHDSKRYLTPELPEIFQGLKEAQLELWWLKSVLSKHQWQNLKISFCDESRD